MRTGIVGGRDMVTGVRMSPEVCRMNICHFGVLRCFCFWQSHHFSSVRKLAFFFFRWFFLWEMSNLLYVSHIMFISLFHAFLLCVLAVLAASMYLVLYSLSSSLASFHVLCFRATVSTPSRTTRISRAAASLWWICHIFCLRLRMI